MTDSKAASFYNPSLLLEKKDSSFSLGGSTFSSYRINSAFGSERSTAFAPSYLGSVIVGTNLVHEFFYWTTGDIKLSLAQESASENLTHDYSNSESALGYSMAFRSVPLAMQFGLKYAESQNDTLQILKDPTNNVTETIQSRSEIQSAIFLFGMSTFQRFGGYGLGFQVQPNRLKLFENKKMNSRSTRHSGTSIVDSTSDGAVQSSLPGVMIRIGHSFRTHSHEFLTDTVLNESIAGSDSYKTRQSFGYRFIGNDVWEYFCGLNRGIGKNSLSFSEDQYVSTGFSWRTRASRSAVGIYYSKNETDVLFESTGLNFSTEFTY